MSDTASDRAGDSFGFIRRNIRQYGILFALIVIMAFFQVVTGGILFRPVNLTNLFLQNSHIVIMGVGMLLVIVAGHIDLSVGSVAAFVGAPVFAAGLTVNVEVPRLNVSEYHRPYVAAWIERPDQTVAGNLAVWYDVKNKGGNAEGEGTKWLKDMRQWWRKSGRDLQMPVDGLSGATRAPGEHTLTFSDTKGPLDKLPAGEYAVVVEAAREVGGRELVKIPFKWKGASSGRAQGKTELGLVTLTSKS